MSIDVRYAEGDTDVVNIHRFLCVVAGPMLPGPIDGRASAIEVWRVVNEEIALIALDDENNLVGTMGIVSPRQWWNPAIRFLANRWFFTLPGSRAAKPLLKEAKEIAIGADIELHIFDERRERLVIFNKNKLRQEAPNVLRK